MSRLLAALLIMAFCCTTARAELNGTYTIGGAEADYQTIEAAVAALGDGVTGPVTFLINEGTYTAPEGGYELISVAGADQNTTITFKPAENAAVVIEGDLATPIFTFNGGDFYIFDGSNSEGGSSRNWKIVNTGNAPVLQFVGDATYNTIQNMYLVGRATAASVGIVHIGNVAENEGNSFNVIARNTIGDSTGTLRSRTAIYARGHGTYRNSSNRIEGNDIINFGRGNNASYGIYIAPNNRFVKVFGNHIRQTSTAGTAPVDVVVGIYYNYSGNRNDTIAYNRIWDLNPLNAEAELYGIRVNALGITPMVIHHNMITLVADAGTLTGISLESSENSVYFVDHNSIFITGSSDDLSASHAISVPLANVMLRNNILSNTRTSESERNLLLFRDISPASFTSDHNLYYAEGPGTAVGAYGGGLRISLEEWQEATGNDLSSIFSAPAFPGVADGDLHIDAIVPFKGESAGTPLGYLVDIDGDLLSPVRPDIGADEGNFNGDGLILLEPNGGEKFSSTAYIPVRFTATREMDVLLRLSVDNGSSWTTVATLATVEGENTVLLTPPALNTTTALVQVVSMLTEAEGDLSDATFEIFVPEFTLLSPNGGETLVPTDMFDITWNSNSIPEGFKVQLDYTTDNGANWLPIATDLATVNAPGSNSYSWEIPNTPSTSVQVRVKLVGIDSEDLSDAVFTIQPQPNITLVWPNSGKLFVGEQQTIRWTAVTTDYVRLEYSINGGATWSNVVPAGVDIPAFLGEYAWTIPNSPSNNVLVRVSNVERSRFADTSDATLAIVRSVVQVLSPNGGEKYPLAEPITVTWASQEAEHLRLQFSSDNGFTWQTILDMVDATLGSITVTLPPTPTRAALVRLVNADREQIADQSDRTFEILQPKSIVVYTPATGDRFVRGSTTVVSWDAPQVDRVTVQYRPNDGAAWQTLVSSMNAWEGSYVWTVPNQTTTQGKIRIVEVGAEGIVGETGLFSVVEPAAPELRVLAPNGGESFTEGDDIRVRWYVSDVAQVTISYSDDNGASWTIIQQNVAASLGFIDWTAPAPGTRYLVEVAAASGTLVDRSDAAFEIRRRPQPTITIVTPTRDADLKVGSTERVEWSIADITGPMIVEYSVDGGMNWAEITTVNAIADGTYSHDWVVPDEPTTNAAIRVSGASIIGMSEIFTISRPIVKVLQVLAPNGGEIWTSGEQRNITWDGPDEITAVDIAFSADGGTTWTDIQTGVPSAAGSMSYQWTLPTLPQATDVALVRLSNAADASQSDVSDAVFTIRSSVAGGGGAVAGLHGLRLLGNYPNPFAGSTELRWEQQSSSTVELRIYRQDGALLRSLDLGSREPGRHSIMLAAEGLSSGTYLYELRSKGSAVRGTMVLTH